jgi:hypothetical protein
MLNEIILKLLVNITVTDLCVHGEEISKICRELMINLRKRALTLIGTNMCSDMILAVILDDHVVHDHTSLHHLPHLVVRPA